MKKSKLLVLSSVLLCSSLLLTSCFSKESKETENSSITVKHTETEETPNIVTDTKELLVQLTPFSVERQKEINREMKKSIPRQEYEDLKDEDFSFDSEKQESTYKYKDLFIIKSYIKEDKMTAEIEVLSDKVRLGEISEDSTVTEDIKKGSFKDDKTVEENVFRGFTSKILSLVAYTEIDLPIDVSYVQLNTQDILPKHITNDADLFKSENYEEESKDSFVRVYSYLYNKETEAYNLLDKEEKKEYKNLIKDLQSKDFKPYKLNSVEEKGQYVTFISYKASRTKTDKDGKKEVILASDTILGVYVLDNLNNVMFRVDLEDSNPYVLEERTRLSVVLPKEILDKFYNERYVIYLNMESN